MLPEKLIWGVPECYLLSKGLRKKTLVSSKTLSDGAGKLFLALGSILHFSPHGPLGRLSWSTHGTVSWLNCRTWKTFCELVLEVTQHLLKNVLCVIGIYKTLITYIRRPSGAFFACYFYFSTPNIRGINWLICVPIDSQRKKEDYYMQDNFGQGLTGVSRFATQNLLRCLEKCHWSMSQEEDMASTLQILCHIFRRLLNTTGYTMSLKMSFSLEIKKKWRMKFEQRKCS